MRILSTAVILSLAVSTPAVAATSAETALAKLDAAQKEMVARADVKALDAISAPDLAINAPTGRILDRAQFLAMMRDGRIGAEAFERTVEHVSVSGDIGIVMGREVFTPIGTSELGRTYGAVPLQRRYTNVYRRVGNRWLWIARHANVVGRAAAEQH